MNGRMKKKCLSSNSLLKTKNERIELWNEREVVNLIRPKHQCQSVTDNIKQNSMMSRKSYDKPIQQQSLLENKNRLIQIFKDFKLNPYLSPLINHLNAQVNYAANTNNNEASSSNEASLTSSDQSLIESSTRFRASFNNPDKDLKPQFHIHIPHQPPMTPSFYRNPLPDNPPVTPMIHY